MIRFTERLRKLRSRDEDGVALLSAILFMILIAGLSVVLLSVILAQATPVYTAQKNTRTIYAAQAGVQASLGIVRSLAQADVQGKVTGIRSKLPCSVTGKVDGTDAASYYSVVLKYFLLDPTGKDTTWQTTNAMSCTGTVLSGTTQPLFALALADGLGAVVPGNSNANYGNRYISAVYKFKVTNVNVPGGRIWDYNNAYCLEATSAQVGATVVFRTAANCTADKNPTQLWVYDKDYEIKLASTTVSGQTPLCITSPTASATSAAEGSAVLAVCQADATRWNQLWSWVGSNSWLGQKSDNSGNSNYCLATGTVSNGSALTVRNGCSGGLAPSTSVGAGAASKDTNQIVNYQEFGRCADVTDVTIAKDFMISYPCKQDPTGTGNELLWNHKWYYTEPTLPATSLGGQQIFVKVNNDANQRYCLVSPGVTGGLVTFTSCTAASTVAAQTWTRVLDTGTYATSYLFTDNKGLCLAVDPTRTYTTGKWSEMMVATCNGGLAQKWNAPASYSGSDVTGYKEYSK